MEAGYELFVGVNLAETTTNYLKFNAILIIFEGSPFLKMCFILAVSYGMF